MTRKQRQGKTGTTKEVPADHERKEEEEKREKEQIAPRNLRLGRDDRTIVVPHGKLTPPTLRAIVEEFVTRDGTDHSSVEERIEVGL